ncbi:hypothetical protein HWV62_9015 [Athelia sp. TMB]|nr:hypothetical protein HWV62_9015 [Athelia sp. TMB]
MIELLHPLLAAFYADVRSADSVLGMMGIIVSAFANIRQETRPLLHSIDILYFTPKERVPTGLRALIVSALTNSPEADAMWKKLPEDMRLFMKDRYISWQFAQIALRLNPGILEALAGRTPDYGQSARRQSDSSSVFFTPRAPKWSRSKVICGFVLEASWWSIVGFALWVHYQIHRVHGQVLQLNQIHYDKDDISVLANFFVTVCAMFPHLKPWRHVVVEDFQEIARWDRLEELRPLLEDFYREIHATNGPESTLTTTLQRYNLVREAAHSILQSTAKARDEVCTWAFFAMLYRHEPEMLASLPAGLSSKMDELELVARSMTKHERARAHNIIRQSVREFRAAQALGTDTEKPERDTQYESLD